MNIKKSKIKLTALALCVGISGFSSATPSANFDKANKAVDKNIKPVIESVKKGGIYAGTIDNSCNNSSSCNAVINEANGLAISQAFADNYRDISYTKSIMHDSTSYAADLALNKKSKDIYNVLVNTKNQAFQKAQLEMLVDIDQQLRLLNSKFK